MRVSVVIRTYNEAASLAATLRAVLAQRGVEPEVVVVDSESTDGTREIAASFPVKWVVIPKASFTYGRALNVGIAATSAPVVANLSAHALPFDRDWLRNLTRPFDDPLVDGVVGKTLPHPDCNPFDRRGLLRQYGTEPRCLCDGGMPSFANANGAIRRAAWHAQPFDETLPFSEDLRWARQRLGLGRRLAYAPDAVVFHSHNETPAELQRRFWNEARALETIDPHHPAYRCRALWWDAAAGTLYDWWTVLRTRAPWRWFWFAPVRRAAINVGRYLGARAIELPASGGVPRLLLARLFLRAVQLGGSLATRLAPRVVVLTRKHPRPLHPKHLLGESPDHHWYAAELPNGRAALDIGCNVGAHTNFVARQGLMVVGMDTDLTALGQARFLLKWEGAGRALVVQADADRVLPFADASFDRALALDVIEHLDDPARFLAEVRRVLSRDGVLLLTAPNAATPWKQRLRRAGLSFFADPTHRVEYTRDGLRQVLAGAGFAVVREEPIVADTPAAPWYDLLGAFSLTLYRRLAARKRRRALAHPDESTGFRLVARKVGD
jgi:rhamnosyltransferase